MTRFLFSMVLAGVMAMPAAAQGPVLGDAAACATPGEPAILATLTGLKDRKGDLRLELYPPNDDDFTRDDNKLIAEGKTFRRVRVAIPAGRAAPICIRVPHPGRYALLAVHDRDGKMKFNAFQDGAGVPSGVRIGMAKPKVTAAIITVGEGTLPVSIRMQYFHIFGGFGPVN